MHLVVSGSDQVVISFANDTDGDFVCDIEDTCPNGDDRIDNNGDMILDACGECPDDDQDGVCNAVDQCPIGDDNIDANVNNIPDACECANLPIVVQGNPIIGNTYSTSDQIISDGTVSSGSILVFNGRAGVELQGGFAVELGAQLLVSVDLCNE